MVAPHSEGQGLRRLDLEQTRELQARAERVIPGGVNSYARTFDVPINFERGAGSKIYDVDGNEYVDYLNAWGAISIGHCDERVNEAASAAVEDQDLYGYGTTELEVEATEALLEHLPAADKAVFGVTGSEVTSRAAHLARAVTGRSKMVKFQGHYHGWYDTYARNFHSDEGDLDEVDASSAGILPEVLEETIVLPFNDEAAVREAFEEHGDEIAGVILEPIAHNMGCITPREGFLELLREVTDANGSLLVFDEIITGFRHAMTSYGEIAGVEPDLSTFGKGIANGYPVSALAGRAEYMDRFTTGGGDVAFGGTFNTHPSAMAAVLETLRIMEAGEYHEPASELCETISAGIEDHIEDLGLSAHVRRYGTVFLTYFMDEPAWSYRDTLRHDEETYLAYRWGMVDRGIMAVPKNIRRNYLTASHTEEDAERTIDAAGEALRDAAAR